MNKIKKEKEIAAAASLGAASVSSDAPLITISVGGSLIVPDGIDEKFLQELISLPALLNREGYRAVLVTGGGAVARRYQEAARRCGVHGGDVSDTALDLIGIAATRVNAELLRALFSDDCDEKVIIDPLKAEPPQKLISIAAGWKPGRSTDYIAILLAERLGASMVINLSNITHVYTDDPRHNPDAAPITHMSWEEMQALVGDRWDPGSHVPFDPIATAHAMKLRMRVVVMGPDFTNLGRLLRGESYVGTTIC